MSTQTENVLVDVAERVAQPEASWHSAMPEEQLNCFVRVVASVERVGNALGTLAFTWATVVLLGGYPTSITCVDFAYATALFFLEAARMFCPNRSEYQLFFRTRGALRPFSWNRVIVVICLNNVGLFLPSTKSKELSVSILMLVAATLPFPGVHKLKGGPLRNAISLLSPLVVMVLLIPCLWCKDTTPAPKWHLLLLARAFYTLLLVMVLLLTISKLQFPSIVRLVHRLVIHKSLSCHQVILFSCMYLAAVPLVFFSPFLLVMIVFALLTAMCGSLQIPAAVMRIVIGSICLLHQDYYGKGGHANNSDKTNLKPTHMHLRNKLNLTNFAMESLESDSRKKQLCGVRILYSLVNREPYDKQVLSKVTNSMKTVTTLIQMLGWTNQEDNQIRLLRLLEIVTIPGAMNSISSLLDNQNKQQIQELIIQKDSGGEENCWILKLWHQMTKMWSILEEEQWTETDVFLVLGLVTLERLATYDIVNCMEISRSMDLIPKITEFTSNNSERICVNETSQKILIDLSLKVLRRLASIGGETGITLRHKISEDPFLLGNLAEILEDSKSSQELRKLTIDILIKLAMDETTKREIGSIQVIVQMLMFAFTAQDDLPGAYSDCSMTMKAGQALSMLTLESADNCSAIMKEPGHRFFKDVARMLVHDNRYIHVAANVLQNLCKHSRVELGDSDLVELSSVLPEVLGQVMDAEGKELEVLVGLSSQICRVSPKSFSKALEQGQKEARFVEKLINALNANMKPNPQFPGIRSVIVEQCIYMMELSSRYATYFRNHELMEALIRVEKTPSRAEKYRLFLGNTGLIEHRVNLSSLVERAKQLMAVHSTQQP
uniref:BLE2 protein n=1 Tax=Oryza meridionalis TaxID=40149 RepID=A0A0E0EFA6_9ORYZ